MKPLKDFLSEESVILHCGGTGSELMKRGGAVPGGLSCLLYPDLVRDIQREYVEVGATLIQASTFSMNPIYAKDHIPDYDWAEINRRGVALAQESADGKAYVLANIGPTGLMMEPFGPLTPKDAENAFAAQIEVLLECGVDGFSIQTFFSLKELEAAVRAVRRYSDLPIIATVVLNDNGATLMGESLEQAYETLMPLGIESLGHNCGDISAERLAELMAPLAAKAEIPLIACPNAGIPKVVKGETVYDMTPEAFARGITVLKEHGVRILGGCCGTDRYHIAAAAKVLAQD
ncbi:MAG: homocysteine S-methyltransferase family protein [Bacillota bacterium]|nr:homocysteine S-methyltransferase family protein [Bacillota bacterium]